MIRSFRLGRRSSTLWLLGDVPTRAKLMSQCGRVARMYGCTVLDETAPSHGYTPPSLPEVRADGSCEPPPHMAWADAIGIAIEPSPDAWAAAFAYLYGKGADYAAELERSVML